MGNALWHTDSTYHQQRSKYSLLLSHGDVAAGSFTHYADTRRAYADLPQSIKDQLENLIVEHEYVHSRCSASSERVLTIMASSLWHSRKLASPQVFGNPTERELALKPPAYHKLVQIAPDGRKTLYLAAHAKRIVGMSFEQSQKLIWDLMAHCTQQKVCLHLHLLSSLD